MLDDHLTESKFFCDSLCVSSNSLVVTAVMELEDLQYLMKSDEILQKLVIILAR